MSLKLHPDKALRAGGNPEEVRVRVSVRIKVRARARTRARVKVRVRVIFSYVFFGLFMPCVSWVLYVIYIFCMPYIFLMGSVCLMTYALCVILTMGSVPSSGSRKVYGHEGGARGQP